MSKFPSMYRVPSYDGVMVSLCHGFFFFGEEWFGGITLRRSLLEIELSLFESCLFLIKFTFAGMCQIPEFGIEM